jgi:hypothetical protein
MSIADVADRVWNAIYVNGISINCRVSVNRKGFVHIYIIKNDMTQTID